MKLKILALDHFLDQFYRRGKKPTRANACARQIFFWLSQRLIVAGRKFVEEIVLVEREVLHESDRNQLFLRVDLAIGGGRAVPAKLSQRSRYCPAPWIDAHLDSEPKAFRAVKSVRALRQRTEMIGGHQFDGLAAEDALA